MCIPVLKVSSSRHHSPSPPPVQVRRRPSHSHSRPPSIAIVRPPSHHSHYSHGHPSPTPSAYITPAAPTASVPRIIQGGTPRTSGSVIHIAVPASPRSSRGSLRSRGSGRSHRSREEKIYIVEEDAGRRRAGSHSAVFLEAPKAGREGSRERRRTIEDGGKAGGRLLVLEGQGVGVGRSRSITYEGPRGSGRLGEREGRERVVVVEEGGRRREYYRKGPSP